jgi:VWFA-related protein
MTKLILQLRLLICVLLLSTVAGAQTPEPTPPEPKGKDQPEVLRVFTELVQTDVMVFDKQGHFVNGLKGSDFELRIDGKPRPVEFFEKIVAGSQNEELQLAAARGASSPVRADSTKPDAAAPLDRGRPIFFYVDDLHMDLTSITTARKLIAHFIENEMGQNDEVAIASASGQIGFLQQLTDNKAVLTAALERLKFRPQAGRDLEQPPMTEYHALLITNYDKDITDYFTEATMRLFPGITRETAEQMVMTRARVLMQQGGSVTTNSLAGLEGLIKSAAKLPGRKLVFFLSGGFFVDSRNSDSQFRLQRITSAAARSGVVIYSMDTRGLVASLMDASQPSQVDMSGRLARANNSELLASQDGMHALAADTGGKAVFNTNSLDPGLARALKDTSNYYLLAWKPDHESESSTKFRRIEVKVIGRSDLNVQVRRGFFDREPEPKPAKAKNAKAKENEIAKTPEAQLRKVMVSTYPEREIPLALSLSYLATPTKGIMLSTALQVPNEFLTFEPVNGKLTSLVTVAGTVYDDKGNAGATFQNHLTIEAVSTKDTQEGTNLTYGYPVYVKPGLYQVRVGVLDEKTGHAGTAHGWIKIPELSQGHLALSSLMMGLRATPAIPAAVNAPEPVVEMSIDHNFNHDGFLRFLVIIYNAAVTSAEAKPDVAIQVQIIRDEQPVVTTALKKVTVDGLPDLTKIPYAAEIGLNGLPTGRYVLQVTVVDRVTKTSSSQQSRFEVN